MLKPPLDWPDMGALRFPFHRISAQTEEPGGAAVPVKYTKDGAHRQLLPNSWPHIQPNIRWDVFRIRSQKLISMWVVSLALCSCKKTSMHAIYCKFLPWLARHLVAASVEAPHDPNHTSLTHHALQRQGDSIRLKKGRWLAGLLFGSPKRTTCWWFY